MISSISSDDKLLNVLHHQVSMRLNGNVTEYENIRSKRGSLDRNFGKNILGQEERLPMNTDRDRWGRYRGGYMGGVNI